MNDQPGLGPAIFIGALELSEAPRAAYLVEVCGGGDPMLAVSEALERLTLEHPVQAEVVKLRHFVGLTNEEIGQLPGVSGSTVKNDWVFARPQLFREINGGNQVGLPI